ncbi:MAG: hypothetical protein L3K17_07920 [Thermoplasmata archaeon]|nr:hypothetical protein [Thermoplasmata archaeon]
MVPPSVHYELLIPNPVVSANPKRSELLPLTINSTGTTWLEVHRIPNGRVRYLRGGGSEESVGLAFESLRQGLSGLALGRRVGCPAIGLHSTGTTFLRAVPLVADRASSTLCAVEGSDAESLLLRRLSGERLTGANLVVQLLFRPTFRWERGRFPGPWWGLRRDREDPRAYS